MRTLLLVFLWALTAAAQNTLDVPSEVEVGHKLVADCTVDIPDGGRIDILWSTSPGLESEQVGQRMFIWGPASSTPYRIDAVVIPLRTITIGEETFDVISGSILRMDASFRITGNVDPPDPPGPDPPDPPDPTQAPFPTPGFSVLILMEAQATGPLPEAQKAILTNIDVRRYVWEKCVRLDDGQPFVRFWDDDYSDDKLSGVPAVLKAAYRKVLSEQSRGVLPWIAVSNGKTGTSQPLPADVPTTLALLKRFGG